MLKKRGYSIVMLLLLVLLTACGGGDEETKQQGEKGNKIDEKKEKHLKITTGSMGGVYFPLGEELTQIIQDESDLKADVFSSEGVVDNIKLLEKKEYDVAFTQADIATYAKKGERMFDKKMENVKGLGILYPEPVQIITAEKSDLYSVADLKGKTVAVGEPGSATHVHAKQILKTYDLSFDDLDIEKLSFDDAAIGIEDGNIDAAFITAAIPTGAVEGLSGTEKLRLIPLEENRMEQLIHSNPHYKKEMIPRKTYDLDKDIATVSTKAMLIVHKDVPEDVVYKLTKTIYENTDQITHDIGEKISVEAALDGMNIDLHEGAKKYFEEKGVIER